MTSTLFLRTLQHRDLRENRDNLDSGSSHTTRGDTQSGTQHAIYLKCIFEKWLNIKLNRREKRKVSLVKLMHIVRTALVSMIMRSNIRCLLYKEVSGEAMWDPA